MEAASAARVGGDHAADRCRGLGRVWAQELSNASSRLLQLRQTDRGSANGAPGMNLQLAEPFEREHPSALRHARPGQSGAGPRNRKWDAFPHAISNDVLNVRNRLRNHNALGVSLVAGRVFEKSGNV